MDLAEFLQTLQQSPSYRGQIVHVEHLPAREASYGELTTPPSPVLRERLEALGIARLYSHQADAVNHAREGRNVTIATSTASGKSLCYNIPVIESLLEAPRSRALYLFPTKALAQDQLGKLTDTGFFNELLPATYDADTPPRDRRLLRNAARTILTNPDMLHLGILPYHTLWGEFFRNLKTVVIDEVHTYRGVFGSHVSNVIRRLRRVCAHYGSDPRFIACSATIANPGELVERLTGEETTVVDRDGAPRGPRLFVFWEPPKLDKSQGLRRSANIEAATLMARLAQAGIRSITFTRARVTTELLLRYAREEIGKQAEELVPRIASYRAGYTAEDRREIERKLFGGELLGVTSTTALELGIDVGGLDACVMTGYPGSIAGTWQQAGRAGRGGALSLAILVAADGPLDQYLINHPRYFFARPPEQVVVDPENPYILAEQLLCAAYEIPITETDFALFGERAASLMPLLEESGSVLKRGKWHWVGDGYPAGAVNIRTSGGEPYQILDASRGDQLLGSADAANAFLFVHEGAVYLHGGESYKVEKLDLRARTARVRPGKFTYYTSAQSHSSVSILESLQRREIGGGAEAICGEVEVTDQVFAYRRKQLITNEVLGVYPLDLPAQTFETQGFWITLPESIPEKVREAGLDFAGGIHAIEHAAIGLLPLLTIADRNDVSGLSHPNHPDLGQAAIFVYDCHPGGVGISQRCYEMLDRLLQATHDAIAACDCEDGCPSCIQSPRCGNNNDPLDKPAAVMILDSLLA